MPSEKLIKWHKVNCPDIPVESIEFTLRLIEKINNENKEEMK
jgi:hypothetical protein